jgi:hypothetical protein
MLNILFSLPVPFWLVAALLIGGGIRAVRCFGDGTGLPMLAVLGTVAAWYVGDVFYNDYPNNHAILFTSGTLWSAWFQVAWFLIVFILAVPEVHKRINGRLPNQRSGAMQLFSHGVDFPVIQEQLREIFWFCAGVWGLIFLLALVTLKGEVKYFLFPFLGYQATPWSHGRIGTGFDALSVLGFYLHLLSCTMFGVVAALATDKRVRRFAITLCLFAWPFFIFDRTRNTMLAMLIPAVLSWVFLRMRGGLFKKITILLVFFMLVNGWMKFIIANRSEMTIGQALKSLRSGEAKKEAHNAGLNMFEELCWISKFIEQGTYHVNWGKRYFAELVNPIPRGIWHGKPLIGIDYAIARGMGGGDADQAGVVATVSTGLIGQGVVNFGRVLGPAAAAILMALWVAWLARLDLEILRLWHLPLYSLGLILTFNLGRDITLITIYTFLFGLLLARWLERRRLKKGISSTPATVRRPATVQVQPLTPARNTFVRRAQSGFVKRSMPKNSGNPPT